MTNWSKDDFIRWAEWQLLGQSKGAFHYPYGPQDLRVWLARERDNKKYPEIARVEFQVEWRRNQGRKKNQGAISLVRRRLARVEKFLNRKSGGEFGWTKRQRGELKANLESFFAGLKVVPIDVSPSTAHRRKARNGSPRGTKNKKIKSVNPHIL
jgi:hypothetical protein